MNLANGRLSRKTDRVYIAIAVHGRSFDFSRKTVRCGQRLCNPERVSREISNVKNEEDHRLVITGEAPRASSILLDFSQEATHDRSFADRRATCSGSHAGEIL